MYDNYDYVIIGSGAAGSVLAHSLPRTSTILLVDIGKYGRSGPFDRTPPPYIDDCPDHYTPAFSGVLGGNTELWSGKVYLITPDELEEWPISFEELERFSSELADVFGVPHSYVYNRVARDENSFFHTSYRSGWGNLYEYLNLEHLPNISVLEEHSVIDMVYDQDSRNVSSVLLSSRQGETKSVSVNCGLILAAGALGNTQILLNLLESGDSAGVRKSYGSLSDHPHFNTGFVENVKPLSNMMKGYLRVGEKFGLEDCLVVSGKKSMVGIQIDSYRANSRLLDRMNYRANRVAAKKILLSMNRIVSAITNALKCLSSRRYPLYSLELFFSQQRDPFNEITLSSERDGFGLYKIDIRHRIDPDAIAELQGRVRRLLGQSVTDIDLSRLSEKNVYTGLHPSCTTPMGSDGGYGTVDINLRVRGFANLYCVGSNVFPTNGITNPTWTIMTLAHRLAAFLQTQAQP